LANGEAKTQRQNLSSAAGFVRLLTRMSVMAFLKQFPDDDACWSHLERVRWPAGPVCPKCGNVGPNNGHNVTIAALGTSTKAALLL
jgi:hypothetical protein